MLQRPQLAALHLLNPTIHPSIISKQTAVTVLVPPWVFPYESLEEEDQGQ